ncbi:MAG: hypothetical protein C5B59_09480 [Bacteroidetes bacterium]|nr:MAG: hypothetical protein C5B59_09480 [Bacteroidota bacterium]
MEKFIFLFRGPGPREMDRNSEAAQAEMQKWFNWIDAMNKKGTYVAGDPLQPVGKQVNGKKKAVTDGPFVEAKEMVGGYIIVNAKDINDAVEISKDCPIFDNDGKVEVRPIQKM